MQEQLVSWQTDLRTLATRKPGKDKGSKVAISAAELMGLTVGGVLQMGKELHDLRRDLLMVEPNKHEVMDKTARAKWWEHYKERENEYIEKKAEYLAQMAYLYFQFTNDEWRKQLDRVKSKSSKSWLQKFK